MRSTHKPFCPRRGKQVCRKGRGVELAMVKGQVSKQHDVYYKVDAAKMKTLGFLCHSLITLQIQVEEEESRNNFRENRE